MSIVSPDDPLYECDDEKGAHQPAAKEAVLRRLSPCPKVRALAACVADFYGGCLQYHESHGLPSSGYVVKLERRPIRLIHARIELQLGTNRIQEALVHELLHLRVATQGYPIPTAVCIPLRLARHSHDFLGMYPRITNLLEHEIMFDWFLALGFQRVDFLGSDGDVPDYRELASITLAYPLDKEILFPWWCLEYLRHWMFARHIGKSGNYAEDALYWGSTVYPEIEGSAQDIRHLIESGSLRDPSAYPGQVNRVLATMNMPTFTEWARLQSLGNTGCAAVPYQSFHPSLGGI